MDEIKLVCAQSIITRKTKAPCQRLSFLALVANLAYEKQIDVLWAGEDGVWHTLPATYQTNPRDDQEYWLAETELPLTADHSLPGNVEFALRYHALGAEYWDNNDGQNHSIQADSGVQLARDVPVLNLGSQRRLTDGQTLFPVTVAVDTSLEAQRVTVHWTTDDWQTTRRESCQFRRDYWNIEFLSNARNPNQYGSQIWDAQLNLEDVPNAQYKISCESKRGTLWDDNSGRNYWIRPASLKVLILNLHCYQEEHQHQKFLQIAQAINDLEIDIVCLQEVAELWNNGMGDWATNSARIINDSLDRPYQLVTDWAHLGFDRYREGVAILSRYPIAGHEARYVSGIQDPYNIHSRKAILAQVNVPFVGLINVFSAHLSWWDDGFSEQFGNLRQWARDAHTRRVKATLLCGDFNIKAGSRGYQLVVESNEYEDEFLAATRPRIFSEIFRNRVSRWEGYLDDDHRIDYVFMHNASDLRVISGGVLFTEQDYGRVSDHVGYLMTFERK